MPACEARSEAELPKGLAERGDLYDHQKATYSTSQEQWRDGANVNVGGGLDVLSRVNKAMRGIVTPTLFSRLKVHADEQEIHTELSALTKCPEILQAVR